MKKNFAALAVAVVIAALAAFVLLSPASNAAPEFHLTALDGRNIDTGSLKGKVTLVNFWFPTCPGCASEMPKLAKMANDYQGRDFQILGIAVPTNQPADSLDGVKNYAASRKLPFAVMFDADKAVVGKFVKTELYPTSVLINKRGEVLKTFVSEPDFAALYRQVDEELAK
jgi:hypothetical protein